jgi:hypothetical protein
VRHAPCYPVDMSKPTRVHCVAFASLVLTALAGCSSNSGAESGSGGDGAGNVGATGAGADGSGGAATGGTGQGGAGANGGTGGVNTPTEAHYPLELVSPRAPGTMPGSDAGTPPMPSGHRIFKAYPGLEYNVRAVVIGGSYPFQYSLSDAPAGMTIDASTGVISWPDPDGGSVTPTLTVTDAEGTTQTSSWTIAVGTAGFRFVDAVNGSDNAAGTLGAPWRTLSELRQSGSVGDIVYFRAGTYTTAGMPVDGEDTWAWVDFDGGEHPVQWLAYPGETPVIDNDYVSSADGGQYIRIAGSDQYPAYLDGFEITNGYDKGLQFGSWTHYAVFRRLDVHGIEHAINGSNSAGIMTLAAYDGAGWYTAYQENDFHDNAPGGIKQYSHKKVLWEDCQFRASGGGPDLKSHVPRFEVRNSRFIDNTGAMCGLFGNMNFGGNGMGETATGEIRYNLMLCGDDPYRYAMDVNQDGMAGEIFLNRNTFVGTVRVRNTSIENGPFHFERNVIVNSNEGIDHVTLEEVSAPEQVILVENLSGFPADGIVDASGNLQGEYQTYLGTRGYQIP